MLHLIEDDQEWNHCFREAAIFSTGSALRDLFITALTFGQLIDPTSIWVEYCSDICDDLTHKLRTQFPGELYDKYAVKDEALFYMGQSSLDYGLYLLHEKLGRLDFSLETYKLPSYKNDWSNDFEELSNVRRASSNSLINEQLMYDREAEKSSYESKYALFNED
ncbi:hypothetical protein [Parasitella parasitica]|uniref:Uncharacterized protein n=1 Tax=Parasitella parasitica TaxID=35722 RepID=A0A0B7NWC7_9FUNG|nr:hypothetical protein [Parasitella parasitica]